MASINQSTSPEFAVAERASGACASQALLRWSLVIVFLWFGGMKFTGYEAHGIAPFIAHSPIMSWLHAAFGIQGASDVIGTLELSTAVALAAGAFVPVLSAFGAAMSAMTYLITLTFFVTTPGVAEATAGGFPAISALPGQFLLKDVVLLAASLSLLATSCRAFFPGFAEQSLTLCGLSRRVAIETHFPPPQSKEYDHDVHQCTHA